MYRCKYAGMCMYVCKLWLVQYVFNGVSSRFVLCNNNNKIYF